MCPACIASVALMIGSVMSTGGLTALAAKLRSKKRAERLLREEPKRKEK
jgi:hypothetical protein